MCNPGIKSEDYSKGSSSPPPAMQAASDVCGSDLDETNDVVEPVNVQLGNEAVNLSCGSGHLEILYCTR